MIASNIPKPSRILKAFVHDWWVYWKSKEPFYLNNTILQYWLDTYVSWIIASNIPNTSRTLKVFVNDWWVYWTSKETFYCDNWRLQLLRKMSQVFNWNGKYMKNHQLTFFNICNLKYVLYTLDWNILCHFDNTEMIYFEPKCESACNVYLHSTKKSLIHKGFLLHILRRFVYIYNSQW